jgi:hypothetical protein
MMALTAKLATRQIACRKRLLHGAIAFLLLAAPTALSGPMHAQEPVPSRIDPPLILRGTIAMPNVEGRIDHFAIDPGGRIFVGVVGNSTVEVLETFSEKHIHTITAVPHPQGAAYVPEFKKLFVGSRDGKLYVFDGSSFSLINSIAFGGDVDRVYVPGGQGFISVFEQSDADHYQLLAEIPSALGARTAGYAARIGSKGRDRFYLAVPARSGHNSAEVWIFQAQE